MKYKVLSIIVSGLLIYGCGSGNKETGVGESHEAVSHDHDAGGHEHNTAIPLGVANEGEGVNQGHPDTSAIQKIKRTVFVPEEVKGKWKSVKLLIKEKKGSGYSEKKDVPLGSSFVIKGSAIKVEVKEFMPHLSIGETSFTSLSNEPVNPAVHLVITENGKELYDGWAYAQFPDMYNFRHDKYSVTLIDFTPAG